MSGDHKCHTEQNPSKGQGEGDGQMQTITYTMDNNEVLLYSTGNNVQISGINYKGKEHEKVMYMCV